MGFSAKPSAKESLPPIPPGSYHGVDYMVIDMGTQPNKFGGPDKPMVRIGWELPELRMENGQLRACWVEYTNSMHEDANLRQLLESWSGRELTHEEIHEGAFDMKKLLGVNAQIQILQRTSKRTGKPYSYVNNVQRLPKGVKKIEAENEYQYFSFEDDMEIPENIPEWIRDKIMDSYEYQERVNGASHDIPHQNIPIDEDMPEMPEAEGDAPF